MEQKDFDTKTLELIEQVSVDLAKECHRLVHSGAIDMGHFSNDYTLPRMILTAALFNTGDRMMPSSSTYKRNVGNLRKF